MDKILPHGKNSAGRGGWRGIGLGTCRVCCPTRHSTWQGSQVLGRGGLNHSFWAGLNRPAQNCPKPIFAHIFVQNPLWGTRLSKTVQCLFWGTYLSKTYFKTPICPKLPKTYFEATICPKLSKKHLSKTYFGTPIYPKLSKTYFEAFICPKPIFGHLFV